MFKIKNNLCMIIQSRNVQAIYSVTHLVSPVAFSVLIKKSNISGTYTLYHSQWSIVTNGSRKLKKNCYKWNDKERKRQLFQMD